MEQSGLHQFLRMITRTTRTRPTTGLDKVDLPSASLKYLRIILASTNAASQPVRKFRVLSVRKIQEFLILQLHVPRLRPNLDFLLVLRSGVHVNKQHVTETDALHTESAQETPKGQIFWKTHTQHTMMVISAGTYLGASPGLNVCGPMILPTQ